METVFRQKIFAPSPPPSKVAQTYKFVIYLSNQLYFVFFLLISNFLLKLFFILIFTKTSNNYF